MIMLILAVRWGDFRIPNCHEMALELVCGADFWCNRHCRTRAVVLEGFLGQVWPKLERKTCKNQNTEYQVWPKINRKPAKIIDLSMNPSLCYVNTKLGL